MVNGPFKEEEAVNVVLRHCIVAMPFALLTGLAVIVLQGTLGIVIG